MKYAVFKTGGKQYKVSEGDIIEIDKLPLEKNSQVEFDQILLCVSDGKIVIGEPFLKDIRVVGKVLDQVKGEKIRVAKFKAKARYRRVTGFRARLTSVQIEEIGEKKASSKTPKKIIRKSSKKADLL